ncbi:hypothetical protein [Flavobacterium sp.]|uniref:hypothetical protein n=1 Tax=Flavobacterium sp. TaxID=239 RepID=UPI00326647D2
MKWIHKTFIFISLLIITFFAIQAENIAVEKIETEKSDTNFSKNYVDTSDFIQPQSSYQFAVTIKTNQPNLVKWLGNLLVLIPSHQVVKSVSNFSNQYFLQSKEVSLLLYPFHYFW